MRRLVVPKLPVSSLNQPMFRIFDKMGLNKTTSPAEEVRKGVLRRLVEVEVTLRPEGEAFGLRQSTVSPRLDANG